MVSRPGAVRAPARMRACAAPFDRPARTATRLSLAAALLVLAGELVVPGGWGGAAWVLLVAGLLIGLPHGAVDHLLPASRLGWRPVRVGLFALGYAALAAAAYGLFLAFPGPALGIFVAVSIWHFGSGETVFADLRAGRPLRPRVPAALTWGAVVLLLPFARGWGDPGSEVAGLTTALAPGWAAPAPQVADLVSVLVVAAAAGLAVFLLRGRRWLEAGELGLLVALALVVPPLAAFGVYFGAWHALRHLARVLAEDPANTPDLAAGRLGRPLRRFGWTAAGPTAAVLLVLGLLWADAGTWRAFVVADVPLLAALTLPHVLVVTWQDRVAAVREGD